MSQTHCPRNTVAATFPARNPKPQNSSFFQNQNTKKNEKSQEKP